VLLIGGAARPETKRRAVPNHSNWGREETDAMTLSSHRTLGRTISRAQSLKRRESFTIQTRKDDIALCSARLLLKKNTQKYKKWKRFREGERIARAKGLEGKHKSGER